MLLLVFFLYKSPRASIVISTFKGSVTRNTPIRIVFLWDFWERERENGERESRTEENREQDQ